MNRWVRAALERVDGRAWLATGVLSLAGFLTNASTFYSLGGVLPAMVHDFHWRWTAAGLGYTILGAACGGSALVPAIIIRRFGVRATLVVGSIIMAAGFASLAWTHGLGLYFVGAALLGVGYQMMGLIPATHALAALYPRRGFPFGLYFTFVSLGCVAGPAAVWLTTQVGHLDWRAYWRLQMVATAALGALCFGLVGDRAWLSRAARRTDGALARQANPKTVKPVIGRAWTVRQALRTPQFAILAAAYFGHLLAGALVGGLSVAQLGQRGVAIGVALGMLSLEAAMQTGGRAVATLLGDRLDARALLIFAMAALTIGAGVLSIAHTYPLMIIYAAGVGLGFGLTALAVTRLLLDYFGRAYNLEIFSLICLVGAVSALGPVIGGRMRDLTGGFSLTFQILAAVTGATMLAAVWMAPPARKAEAPAVPIRVTDTP